MHGPSARYSCPVQPKASGTFAALPAQAGDQKGAEQNESAAVAVSLCQAQVFR